MKRMRPSFKALFVLSVAGALTVSATPAAAAVDIALDMSSLPSAQGWTYFADLGPDETSVFSVSGGTLFQADTPVRSGYYRLSNVVDPSLTFDLSARARITSGGEGFAIYVMTGEYITVLNFSPETIYSYCGPGSGSVCLIASLDNTMFHDYRMTGVLGGTYELFVDDVVVGSGLFVPTSTDPNGLLLGDPGSKGNATVEITSFHFTQPAPVPVPGAALLLASRIAPLALRLRKTRRG